MLKASGEHGLIEKDVASDLMSATILWRNLQGILRLTVEGRFDPASAAPALKSAIVRACGAVDFDALTQTMQQSAAQTIGHYDAIFRSPDS